MELITAIKDRRSTRRFKDQKVAPELIRELLDLAIWAPTASNAQPWGFVVIQDQNQMREISEQAKALNLEKIKQQPRMERYRVNLENPNFNIFYNASALILIYGKKEHPFTPNDCSMAAQNLMLAAWEKGLGSCWIGLAQDICDSAQFKSRHQVPEEYQLVAPLIVGYREKETPAPIPRREYPVFAWIK